ncbi:MAG: putative metal-binding motif-containing protein [Myxococcales bacterium]
MDSGPAPNCADEDGDGFAPATAPAVCAGLGVGDCDDHDHQVRPGAPDSCGNDMDDDCDGEVDEGTAELCNSHDDDCDQGVDEGTEVGFYLDQDGDGVGAGALQSGCIPLASSDAGSLDASSPTAVSTRGDDCDDANPARSPTHAELCDGVDNDCDGQLDNGATNVCGGSCTEAARALNLGDACNNGLKGACRREGQIACQTDGSLGCNAPQIVPGAEHCNDHVDNDCDGEVDEPDAVDATVWYMDCDGDGYALANGSSQRACTLPAKDPCGWTAHKPDATSPKDTDCNDTSPAYAPPQSYGFPPIGFLSFDLNCDGQASPDPFFQPVVKLCDVATIQWANNDRFASCQSAGSGGCVLFKGSNSTFTEKPTAARICPDDPWVVSYENGSCFLNRYKSAIWPCR